MSSRPARKALNAYHHGDLRDALVQAALHEAELAGPEAISISALAKKLGVSQPAPYKHFADRETLLTAVTAEAFRQFSQCMRRVVDRKHIHEQHTQPDNSGRHGAKRNDCIIRNVDTLHGHRQVQRRYRHPDAFGVVLLVLVFRNGELRGPGSGATLHVSRVLLEFDRRRADIEGQNHTSPTAGEAILYND